MEDFIIANCTDTGKVRAVNEDSMSTFDSPNGRVVVVCDGMGGQNAGDVASQLAVAVIQDILTDNTFNSPEEAITRSIMAANQAILNRAAQGEGLAGMGATCVMLIIANHKVYYGSVGDSRIYYVANGMIRQLTKDQSYVQTLVDAGEITQEAAEHHKDKNQITNALGIEGMTPPVVCQMPITPDPGSVFLLCSDGLSGMVSNQTMAQVVSNKTATLQEKAKELVKLANNAGGVDNITVQLVEFPASAGSKASAAGTARAGKEKKGKSAIVWIAAIVCLVLAIGGGTYLLIPDPEPKPATSKQNSDIGNKNHDSQNGIKSNSQTSTNIKKEVVTIEEPAKEKISKTKNKADKNKREIIKESKTPKKKIQEELKNNGNGTGGDEFPITKTVKKIDYSEDKK